MEATPFAVWWVGDLLAPFPLAPSTAPQPISEKPRKSPECHWVTGLKAQHFLNFPIGKHIQTLGHKILVEGLWSESLVGRVMTSGFMKKNLSCMFRLEPPCEKGPDWPGQSQGGECD